MHLFQIYALSGHLPTSKQTEFSNHNISYIWGSFLIFILVLMLGSYYYKHHFYYNNRS